MSEVPLYSCGGIVALQCEGVPCCPSRMRPHSTTSAAASSSPSRSAPPPPDRRGLGWMNLFRRPPPPSDPLHRCCLRALEHHLNPGKATFLSFSGNEFYYPQTLILLVRRICIAKFVASERKKIASPYGKANEAAAHLRGFLPVARSLRHRGLSRVSMLLGPLIPLLVDLTA